MGVGSGGADAWRALRQQVREAERKQAERKRERRDRRKDREELEPDAPFRYEVEPADAILARERVRSREAVIVAGLAAALPAVWMAIALVLEGDRMWLLGASLPVSWLVSGSLTGILVLNALSFALQHHTRFGRS